MNHSVPISMPLSCALVQPQNTTRVLCGGETAFSDGIPIPSSQSNAADSKPPLPSKCYSQPMPNGTALPEAASGSNHPSIIKLKDKRFDSFKTWAGKLERQLSFLRGRSPTQTEEEEEANGLSKTDKPLPVRRYFDALEGPELETPRVCDYLLPICSAVLMLNFTSLSFLFNETRMQVYLAMMYLVFVTFSHNLRVRLHLLIEDCNVCYFVFLLEQASEEIVLPQDKKWPFLLRFPVSSFGICLGVSSQAILWKTLAISPSTEFLHISLKINFILWFFSIALVATIFTIYLLKIILYFEAVRREYYHPIRVNFFFAPWIALLLLALGAPPSVAKDMGREALWYILMSPLFFLELKIYGQWMYGGQRRLSKVANPSTHLSIVGNFVGTLLGASIGLKEGPIFFFAVGLAHYIVLFVTLYQRLPTNETLPKELHPVFFLFVAVPSSASLAWAGTQGSFDYGSRIAYFVAMFLYFSLVSFTLTLVLENMHNFL